MSDALIASLNTRIQELTGQVAQLNAESKTRRIEGKKLKAENEQLTGQVATLTTERDTFKTKAESGPQALNDEIAQLKGQILSRDHTDAFREVKDFDVTSKDKDGKDVVGKYTLNDGVSVDDLWSTLQYKAEGERPDAAKITGLLQQAVASKPYLFKPAGETPNDAPGGAQTAIGTAAARQGPGASRSTSTNSQRLSTESQVDAAHGARDPFRIA